MICSLPSGFTQGCQIFLTQYTNMGENIQNFQMSITFTKWPLHIPNGNNIYRHLPFKGPPKFTQTEIFCLKVHHLATLVSPPGQPKAVGIFSVFSIRTNFNLTTGVNLLTTLVNFETNRPTTSHVVSYAIHS
jgi:hypothetical protein